MPEYSPDHALLSVTVLGVPEHEDLSKSARSELAAWFGPEVAEWQHLRTDRVRQALPGSCRSAGTHSVPCAYRNMGSLCMRRSLLDRFNRRSRGLGPGSSRSNFESAGLSVERLLPACRYIAMRVNGKTIAKSLLPSKTCPVCGRVFHWRKKWQDCWDSVRYCSQQRCRGRRCRNMSDAVHCVWFKRDLRLFDHAPLVSAAARGQIVPVYIIEPEVIGADDFDALHWGFIRESLDSVQRSLRVLGVELQLVRGNAVEVLNSLQVKFGFTHIWAHEETGNAITYGDRAVAAWAGRQGVDLHELPQSGVVRRLNHRDGWARRWEAQMQARIEPVPADLLVPS